MDEMYRAGEGFGFIKPRRGKWHVAEKGELTAVCEKHFGVIKKTSKAEIGQICWKCFDVGDQEELIEKIFSDQVSAIGAIVIGENGELIWEK